QPDDDEDDNADAQQDDTKNNPFLGKAASPMTQQNQTQMDDDEDDNADAQQDDTKNNTLLGKAASPMTQQNQTQMDDDKDDNAEADSTLNDPDSENGEASNDTEGGALVFAPSKVALKKTAPLSNTALPMNSEPEGTNNSSGSDGEQGNETDDGKSENSNDEQQSTTENDPLNGTGENKDNAAANSGENDESNDRKTDPENNNHQNDKQSDDPDSLNGQNSDKEDTATSSEAEKIMNDEDDPENDEQETEDFSNSNAGMFFAAAKNSETPGESDEDDSAEETDGDSADTGNQMNMMFSLGAVNNAESEETGDGGMNSNTAENADDAGAAELENLLAAAMLELENEETEYGCTLNVSAENISQDGWSTKAAVFTLGYTQTEGMPEVSPVFWVQNGDAEVEVDGNVYTAEDGVYSLQFVLKTPEGQELDRSQTYSIKQDTSGPFLILSTTDGYGLIVSGVDAVSGAVSVTVDGGKHWSLLTAQKDGTMKRAYQASAKMTIKAGSIMVRDAAGNVTRSIADIQLTSKDELVTLDSTSEKETQSVSKSTSKSSRTVSHAKSTTTLISAYNGVDLLVDSGSMSQLTMGDEVLDFALYSSENNSSENVQFTARFAAWNVSDGVDTIVLTASDALETDAYTWIFSGTVYKKLAASGISYMVLQTGDNAIAVSTAGFSGGTRYAMYRSSGMVSKDFVYAVTMDTQSDAFSMDMTVDGMTYRMTDNPADELYYYDVYSDFGNTARVLTGEEGEG
ncbi:MAG: hypothetical protein IJ242_07065, partial [Clostridia bacterium]|nr:hypothetical protein [Clostridia bacterium]